MSKTLKVGVIGTGGIFKKGHLPTLLEHPELELVALCDINEEKVQRVAAGSNVSRVFTSFEELIAQDDLDIIDICAPNCYHAEMAIAALEAGKHVFCEKPDAITPEEAIRMSEAAKKNGRILMCMRNNRFMPASQYLKKYIDEGLMGEIYTGRCGWLRRRGIPGLGGWFTTKAMSGGGPLIDLGVHYIDLSVWLMGNPKPIAVSAAIYNKFASNQISDSEHSEFGEKQDNGTFDVEDLATGFIRFDNGATLQIEFSWASNVNEEHNFVEFRGTKAGSALRNGQLSIYSEAAGQLVNINPVLKASGTYTPHSEHLKHFVDCVQHRAEPINSPEHGVDMIKILSAIYESAKRGQEVRL
ncbi:gfo/Idh/MocA family oxidoreductase [Paenibacillus sp. LMG 31461]|uniref:Gfo/Idh/MocA family oxidoreductase n=1 Tax=Paenibacillus plantarum TaxID=2654975 RepID=A0ABX1X8B9_9BACL|nr:Gfo/Idh/MocA family oxidoreductase [Paenibacillus plantarum]NOU64631.1 gfo/Idh/MocA family oxidoreductase [Paenibacillus plantarum]